MPQIGANMEELQALGAKFTQEAQAVNELLSRVEGEVSRTQWQGPAADRFRGAWNNEFRPALRNLSQALEEASTEIKNRHTALTQVAR
jgi:WXG100 family type VII secretion target